MKLYGLIGYPLGHSFSKKYFTDKFQREKISGCRYELFPIETIQDLPQLLIDNPNLVGLNVTIPYKEQVLEFVAQSRNEVKEIKAANTIKIVDGILIAYNTDVIGFENSFTKKLKPSQKKALILGTGGSSKAVQYVLEKLRIDFLLVSRNKTNKEGMIPYSMIDKNLLDQYQVIINCTPVGLSPNDSECPQIPYQFIASDHYLFDLVYKPEKTLFLKKGEEMGAEIQNGYEMLIIQAEESWKIWNEH